MKNKYIEEILNNNKYIYYAHTKENSNDKELLSSHLELTFKYFEKMESYKNLDKKINEMIKQTFRIDDILAQKIYDLFKSAIYYHDIGKINPIFQKEKMGNDLDLKLDRIDSTHAALSARIYIDYTQKAIDEEVNTPKDRMILYCMTYYFGYIISRHHTNLEGISELEEAIKDKNIPQIDDSKNETYETLLKKIEIFIKTIKPDSIGLYVLCKLLYSCRVIADFYATYEYMTGNKVPVDTQKNDDLFKQYKQSKLINGIREYEKGNIQLDGINKLRSDIFFEAEKNLLSNQNNDIYYIEAPTGSGKTNMAINVARILYENNSNIKSVQYIFPFNTIIEQTAYTFDNYFEEYQDYTVINSINSMVKDGNEQLDYEMAYMKNAFRQYPIVITSHVNLFNTLFGNGKEANYALYHLVDSVIVIDEIQAYSNKIWAEMIEMFSKYSSMLNIKFVIMSATLPRLDKLLKKTITKFYPLVSDTKKYYQNQLFKNRVVLNFDLLDKKIDLDDLINEILKYKYKKVLVECIKKKTADELYNRLQGKVQNVYIITGDDNKYRRNEIIKITKKDEPLILISTQTIEAGVDIDMDIGFKDISFIDSEEQFIGRINRSSKKKNCIAYFFNLDDAKIIYGNDYRLQYSLEKAEVRIWLQNKEFDKFYDKILERIYEETKQYTNKNIEKFYNYCSNINFNKIQKTMQLINSQTMQLFLNYTIKVNGEEIRGEDIFIKYKKLYLDSTIGYAEKEIKLSQISEKLNLFIYAVYENKANMIQGEKFGDMFYVENGDEYMENGRFNREKYLSEGDGLFL